MGEKFLSLVVIGLFACMLLPNASALYTEQKSVLLNIEQGESVKYYIYMDAGSSDITHSGEINDWMSHPTSINTGEWLEISVSVPSDAEIGSHNEDILANGNTITKMTIIVTVPFSEKFSLIQDRLNDIREKQDDMESDIGLIDDMMANINSIESEVSELCTDIDAIKSAQRELSEAESQFDSERRVMQDRINDLESSKTELQDENQQLNDMTGMLSVNWSSAGFALGAIVGILVAVLYFRGFSISGVGGFSSRFKRQSSRPSHSKKSDVVIEEQLINETPMQSSRPSQERIRDFRYNYKG